MREVCSHGTSFSRAISSNADFRSPYKLYWLCLGHIHDIFFHFFLLYKSIGFLLLKMITLEILGPEQYYLNELA